MYHVTRGIGANPHCKSPETNKSDARGVQSFFVNTKQEAHSLCFCLFDHSRSEFAYSSVTVLLPSGLRAPIANSTAPCFAFFRVCLEIACLGLTSGWFVGLSCRSTSFRTVIQLVVVILYIAPQCIRLFTPPCHIACLGPQVHISSNSDLPFA